ncbi:MAG TPA: hypothetical protein VGF08_05370, partial [Terriglobales bacterium]
MGSSRGMTDEIVLERRRPLREPSPTLRDILAVLFRQRRLVVISFFTILAGVFLYGKMAPAYQAEMKILVRRGRLDPPMAPQPTGVSEFARDDISEEEMNSEVELLRSADILREAVVAANLQASGRSRWPWRKESDEVQLARAVRRLAQGLHVEPVRKTRLIAVSYESSDAELAARVLGVLGRLYMAKHLAVHRPSGESLFFGQQTARYGELLEAAQLRLLDVNNQGVVSPALERDTAIQRLSEAEAAYRQIPVALSETENRIRSLETQLQSLPERTTTQVRISDNGQLLEQLKSTLLRLQLKRTELLTKFQPSYRLVEEVDRQIAEARSAIAAEELAPIREETTEKDPNREWAKAELEKAEVERSGLKARLAASGTLVAQYRARVRDLGRNALEQQDLV